MTKPTSSSEVKRAEYTAPTAGFQTVLVRDRQVRQIMQYRAMRAQYIKPTDIIV